MVKELVAIASGLGGHLCHLPPGMKKWTAVSFCPARS